MDIQLTQEEIEVRNLLEKYLAYVSELPIKEQIEALKKFQDFLAEQREKQYSVST